VAQTVNVLKINKILTVPHLYRIESARSSVDILRAIGAERISSDGQIGVELPLETAPLGPSEPLRMLGKKSHDGFWANRQLYHLWDGTPQHFNTD
jgi:hypothetical protein